MLSNSLRTKRLAAALSAGGAHFAVDIRRTEYGIPHILAGDYPSLGYGYGYAFAQNTVCVMADRMLTVSGEQIQMRTAGHVKRRTPRTAYVDTLSRFAELIAVY